MTTRKLLVLAFAVVFAALGLAACGGDDDDDGGGEADSGEPILVGITTAQSGALEPYDRQGSQMLQLRLEEINEDGGVLDGRQFEFQVLDTESDRPRTGTNARQLIDQGADVIVATCDFDYSFPALEVARDQGVLGMALCASAPVVADPSVVGETGGSQGQGADAEGVAMAEYLKEANPDMQSAYVFTDTFLEYNVQTSNYFRARWEELGGEICGEAEFVGDEALRVAPLITRLQSVINQCDVVYVGSIVPAGAQVLRAAREAGIDTPFATNVAVNGATVREVAGRVSDFYTLSHRCLPSYCNGANDRVRELNDQYRQRWGEQMDESYSIVPYDLGTAIAEAIEAAGTTDSAEVAAELFSGDLVIDTVLAPGKKVYSEECHRPQPASFDIELWTNGQAEKVDEVTVEEIPDIDDGNTCLDVPEPPE